MVSADHMAISLLVCSRPVEDSISTTVAVTLAMTGQKIPASHPTQAPPTDLQHHIKLTRLHGIIGLKHMKITHLLLIQSLPNRPSTLKLRGIQMILYLKMVLPTWSK